MEYLSFQQVQELIHLFGLFAQSVNCAWNRLQIASSIPDLFMPFSLVS